MATSTKTTENMVRKFLMANNAWWQWEGHKHVALLRSNKLSDVFINCNPIFTDPRFNDFICGDLFVQNMEEIAEFAALCREDNNNFWVVGAAMGGIGLAHGLAMACGARAAYSELLNSGGKDRGTGRFEMGDRPYIMLVEDVITTGGTTEHTIRGIRKAYSEVQFARSVFTVVNRSPGLRIWDDTMDVQALVNVDAKTWDSVGDLPSNLADCTPMRPKEGWNKFVTEKFPQDR